MVFTISVNVVYFQWDSLRPKVHLRPATFRTSAVIFFVQVSFDVSRDESALTTTLDITTLPFGNEIKISIVCLTLLAAESGRTII